MVRIPCYAQRLSRREDSHKDGSLHIVSIIVLKHEPNTPYNLAWIVYRMEHHCSSVDTRCFMRIFKTPGEAWGLFEGKVSVQEWQLTTTWLREIVLDDSVDGVSRYYQLTAPAYWIDDATTFSTPERVHAQSSSLGIVPLLEKEQSHLTRLAEIIDDACSMLEEHFASEKVVVAPLLERDVIPHDSASLRAWMFSGVCGGFDHFEEIVWNKKLVMLFSVYLQYKVDVDRILQPHLQYGFGHYCPGTFREKFAAELQYWGEKRLHVSAQNIPIDYLRTMQQRFSTR